MSTIAVFQSTSQMNGKKEMIVPNAPKTADNMIVIATPNKNNRKHLIIFEVNPNINHLGMFERKKRSQLDGKGDRNKPKYYSASSSINSTIAFTIGIPVRISIQYH